MQEIKSLSAAFALAVTCESKETKAWVARKGCHSLQSALEIIFPKVLSIPVLILDIVFNSLFKLLSYPDRRQQVLLVHNEKRRKIKSTIGTAAFLKVLETECGFKRIRIRRQGVERDSGSLFFKNRRWLCPSETKDMQVLQQNYRSLCAAHPQFAKCTLEQFLASVDKISSSWNDKLSKIRSLNLVRRETEMRTPWATENHSSSRSMEVSISGRLPWNTTWSVEQSSGSDRKDPIGCNPTNLDRLDDISKAISLRTSENFNESRPSLQWAAAQSKPPATAAAFQDMAPALANMGHQKSNDRFNAYQNPKARGIISLPQGSPLDPTPTLLSPAMADSLRRLVAPVGGCPACPPQAVQHLRLEHPHPPEAAVWSAGWGHPGPTTSPLSPAAGPPPSWTSPSIASSSLQPSAPTPPLPTAALALIALLASRLPAAAAGVPGVGTLQQRAGATLGSGAQGGSWWPWRGGYPPCSAAPASSGWG
mmetsp:Transcript_4245/g.12112  ORF Transcript_4245/g.12112 Transcript_4245/m.12112 type:complete len:479 (+) Transcript_4245:105-1541(+)